METIHTRKRSKSDANHIDLLPRDVFVDVFSWLNIKDVGVMRKVNKKFKEILDEERLWKFFCERDFFLQNYEVECKTWMSSYKQVSNFSWDLNKCNSSLLEFSSSNRKVTHKGNRGENAAAVSRSCFTRGKHTLSVVCPNSFSGALGVGFVDENFDATNNSYVDRDLCKNYMFWSVGNFFDCNGEMVEHPGTFPLFRALDIITIELDMENKRIKFFKNEKEVVELVVEAERLWLIVNLFKPGQSLTILKWNTVTYEAPPKPSQTTKSGWSRNMSVL